MEACGLNAHRLAQLIPVELGGIPKRGIPVCLSEDTLVGGYPRHTCVGRSLCSGQRAGRLAAGWPDLLL